MHPLTISVGDFLNVAFVNNALKTDQLVTAVTPSVVNNMNSYAVTAGGVVYTCTAANTTKREQTTPDTSAANTPVKEYWVLGA